ncbi:MAG TPA: C25 family cysteine peptidase [Candidatus Wallbacteria bacterium]|nr:C25 family cysteine peptidase [Candidatus Wallbacteria bacterium]
MKKTFLFMALFIIVSVQAAFAGELVFNFEKPELIKSKIYTDVKLGDLPLSYEPEMPILPFRPVQIMLPPGKTASNVEVVSGKLTEIEESHLLRPAGFNIPLSFQKFAEERRKRIALINGGKEPVFKYKYSGLYPASPMSNFSIQSGRGYKILVLNVHPVFYQAETGKIYYCSQMTVKYDVIDANTNKMLATNVRDIESDRETIKALVENPEMVSEYKPKTIKDKKIDYIIITSKNFIALKGDFTLKTFAEFLVKKGLVVETAAIEDITASSSGKDNAEKLRNFLRKKYNDNNLKYALLAGGGLSKAPIIPVRTLHAGFTWDGQNFDQELPADTYYANLDGSFDGNGNGIYGEPNDGDNGADIDMISELSVGRAPVENAIQIENFVKKTMAAYDYADAADFGKVLFSGENLFPGIFGSSYMGEIENGSSTHGFTTCGYPAAYPRTSLQDTPNKKWSSTDMINTLNSGIYIINHIGHSSVTSNMRLSSWNLSKLVNSKYYLLYTQGCYCGRFTDNGCILASHVTMFGGAYAVIGNSSYGLGPEDPDPDTNVVTRGASEYFHRQFTNAVFAQGKNRLGDANQASKEANIKFMGHGTTRWVYYELNLLGDPYLPLKIK